MVGGSFPAGDPAPRAVTRSYWYNVCPEERRTVLHMDAISAMLRDSEASVIMEKYVQVLRDDPAGCLELAPGETVDHPFDYLSVYSICSAFPELTFTPADYQEVSASSPSGPFSRPRP